MKKLTAKPWYNSFFSSKIIVSRRTRGLEKFKNEGYGKRNVSRRTRGLENQLNHYKQTIKVSRRTRGLESFLGVKRV